MLTTSTQGEGKPRERKYENAKIIVEPMVSTLKTNQPLNGV